MNTSDQLRIIEDEHDLLKQNDDQRIEYVDVNSEDGHGDSAGSDEEDLTESEYSGNDVKKETEDDNDLTIDVSRKKQQRISTNLRSWIVILRGEKYIALTRNHLPRISVSVGRRNSNPGDGTRMSDTMIGFHNIK